MLGRISKLAWRRRQRVVLDGPEPGGTGDDGDDENNEIGGIPISFNSALAPLGVLLLRQFSPDLGVKSLTDGARWAFCSLFDLQERRAVNDIKPLVAKHVLDAMLARHDELAQRGVRLETELDVDSVHVTLVGVSASVFPFDSFALRPALCSFLIQYGQTRTCYDAGSGVKSEPERSLHTSLWQFTSEFRLPTESTGGRAVPPRFKLVNTMDMPPRDLEEREPNQS
jgi:hypothetical protein